MEVSGIEEVSLAKLGDGSMGQNSWSFLPPVWIRSTGVLKELEIVMVWILTVPQRPVC
jgi:hypothetical protein